jgi:hypothetical protein
MRKSALVLSMALVFAVMAHAAGPKSMTRTIKAGDLQSLDISSGIGDVTIKGRDGLDEVTIEVVLTPRRGGFFSSKRQAERDVEAASLETAVKRDQLKLRVVTPKDDDEDRRFEERWILEVPSRLALEIEHGVGDIDIRGVSAGIELDSGVGDVEIEVPEGNVAVDLGVGTAVVRAPAAVYGSAEAAGGVGSASLQVRGEKIESGGFVSKSASWSGDGRFRIEVAVGVGDAVIKLN